VDGAVVGDAVDGVDAEKRITNKKIFSTWMRGNALFCYIQIYLNVYNSRERNCIYVETL